MEGAKESGKVIASDYLKRFDKIIHTIEKKALPASRASGLTDSLANALVRFINRGKFSTSKGKIVAQGYSTRVINDFMKTMTQDLKIASDDAVALIDEFYNVQKTWADFMNIIYKGQNINVTKNEFVDIINSRCGDYLCCSHYYVGTIRKFLHLAYLSNYLGWMICKHTHGELGLTAAIGQHLMLVIPNACDGHQQTAQHMADDILTETIPITNQPNWNIIEKPGLGVDVDEEKVLFYIPISPKKALFLTDTVELIHKLNKQSCSQLLTLLNDIIIKRSLSWLISNKPFQNECYIYKNLGIERTQPFKSLN